MLDTIIVGGGMAGMTAALYCLRNNKKVLVIEKETLDNKINQYLTEQNRKMKILIATEKPFAKRALDGIKEILAAAGYEVALLEKYTEKEELIAAVADVDGLIIRSDKVGGEIMDAAPNLKFERNPSNLLSGFMQKRRQNMKRKELKEFSQNLNDEYNYTMMSNEEFEMLFETKFRNNETEYRLLFTPLAQEQMLKLIKDETDSFGDKFVFMKDKKINYISADQLEAVSLDVGQNDFADYDFQRCREKFFSINESIFKTLYFAMAPILSIPLYQQHRTQKTIYGSDDSRSSSWEWECLLNGVSEEYVRRLKHVGCVTDHIVKAKKKKDVSDGMTEIEAVSCGFSGADRCDTVRVWGGDGCVHRVDVPWVEYSPVTQSSQLMVEDLKMETSDDDEFLPFRQTHACRLLF